MRNPSDMTLVAMFEEMLHLFKLSIADGMRITFQEARERQLRYDALMAEVKRRDEAFAVL